MDDNVPEAEIVREYAFAGVEAVHGVTYDGAHVWFASGKRLHSFDPATGAETAALDVACDAGTAYDGEHLYQLTGGVIQVLEPHSGRVLRTIAVQAQSPAGLTWAEGKLWLGDYRARNIQQIDPESGAVLRTIQSDRFVTGVSWVEGELWHGTWENDASELRRVDPVRGAVLERVALPEGTMVSGLESNGADLFFCGGGPSGKVRAVRKPKRSR